MLSSTDRGEFFLAVLIKIDNVVYDCLEISVYNYMSSVVSCH